MVHRLVFVFSHFEVGWALNLQFLFEDPPSRDGLGNLDGVAPHQIRRVQLDGRQFLLQQCASLAFLLQNLPSKSNSTALTKKPENSLLS